MTKTKVILLVAFLLAFAAGTSLGVFMAQPATQVVEPKNPATHGQHPSPFGRARLQLDLSPDQKKMMDKVWGEEMIAFNKQLEDRRMALMQQRTKDIQALFTPEQKEKYDAIGMDYARGLEELSKDRAKAFDEAVARTKKDILTPKQAVSYDAWLKQQGGERGGDRGRGATSRGGSRRGSTFPATEPASQPATSQPRMPRVED